MENYKKAIMLIDMDSFFASCHIAKNNSLKNKCVVVCSPNDRAIITTANYKARSVGIKAGIPVFKAKKMVKELIIIPPDFSLYVSTSSAIFDFIRNKYSKNIEVVSIDEAYLDVTNEWKKYGSVKKMAHFINKDVEKTFNLTCSIGISTNKFLAKMISNENKPNGVSILLEKDIKQKLWPMPIGDMYGVGIATKEILLDWGIKTIGDLANYDVNKLEKHFGKRGLKLYNNSNGRGVENIGRGVENESISISNEMTLSSKPSDLNEIEDYIYEITKVITERLKKNVYMCKTVTIIIKYDYDYSYEGFNKKDRIKVKTHQSTLEEYTNNFETIFSVAKELFMEIWSGSPILLLGISVSKIQSAIFKVNQLKYTDDLELDSPTDNLTSLINQMKISIGKNIMLGTEFERKYVKNKNNENSLFKFDAEKISQKSISEKWKNDNKL